jgi:uncharacterized protein with NRDE domain
MCILVLAWKTNCRWPLVLAVNRDEYHNRPAAPLHRWQNRDILAGYDFQSGGTWLGLSAGALAAVTNAGPAPVPPLLSRGALVLESLAAGFFEKDFTELQQFNPFNLLTISTASAFFWTNRPEPTRTELSSGFHKLGNGTLNEFSPRGIALERAVADWLMTGGDLELLLNSLSSRQSNKHSEVACGVAPGDAHGLQHSIFILDPDYGTRSSTIVAIDDAGRGQIIERTFTASGSIIQDISIKFQWPGLE